MKSHFNLFTYHSLPWGVLLPGAQKLVQGNNNNIIRIAIVYCRLLYYPRYFIDFVSFITPFLSRQTRNWSSERCAISCTYTANKCQCSNTNPDFHLSALCMFHMTYSEGIVKAKLCITYNWSRGLQIFGEPKDFQAEDKAWSQAGDWHNGLVGGGLEGKWTFWVVSHYL